MARQEMLQRYGMAAYNDGFHVYTTIDSELQQVARNAVINGLLTYDERHGYRGPERQLPPAAGAETIALWLEALAETAVIAGLQPAIVTRVGETGVTLFWPTAALRSCCGKTASARPGPTSLKTAVAPAPNPRRGAGSG